MRSVCTFLGSLFLVFNCFAQAPKQGPRTTRPISDPNPVPAYIPSPKNTTDTAKKAIITSIDSLKKGEDDAFKSIVNYVSSDSTVMEDDYVYLFRNGEVKFEDIELKADYIRISLKKNEIFAKGSTDSTKKQIGTPVFTQAGTTYNADSIRYNFRSKKGIIKQLITQQGDGFVQGQNVKKDQDDNMFLLKGHYTTCDLSHPHFYVNMSKFKVANNPKKGTKQVISGPFNLVINDIPLPVGLPFGYFPMPKQKEIGTSGILMPTYGEEPRGRGFYLRDGGYYFAISEYLNATVTGQIYSRGSWGLGLSSDYKKLYRYNGQFSLQFNRNTTGDEANPQVTPDFQIRWSHSPQSFGRSTFSASVNASTNGFGARNSFNTNTYLQSAVGSSVQYSLQLGTFGRASSSFRVNQNMQNRSLDAGVDYSFGINQFQPFLRKNAITPSLLDQFRLALDVSGSFSANNQIRATNFGYSFNAKLENPKYSRDTTLRINSLDALGEMFGNGELRNRYSVPISLPNFKLFKYLNLTPSFNYQGEIFTKRQNFRYTGRDTVAVQSESGLFNTYNYSFSMSMNTRFYGTFRFKKLGRLQAIRHTVNPTVSANFAPDFSKEDFGFFQRVQVNNKNDYVYAPRFSGLSSAPGPVGGLSFGLTNTFEAKLKSKSDTAAKAFEKIPLLDNFSMNGGYNFLADSLRLSNITMSTSANLLKKINIAFGAVFDPYQYIAADGFYTGKKINRFLFEKGQLAALQNANLSISTNFLPPKAKKKTEEKTSPNATPEQMKQIRQNPNAYVDFDIPWQLNVSYQWSLIKPGLAASQMVSSATFSGSLSLTPKWQVTFNSGYDFNYKAITYSNISLNRDLHCWAMAFNWTPAAQGARANTYSFEIYAKSSILRDLKLSRRRTFYDRGVF